MEHLIAWVKEQAATNQLATGGLFVVTLSYLAHQARELPKRLWDRTLNLIALEVEVRQPDPLYDWISRWLAGSGAARRARRLSATTRLDHLREGERRMPIRLVPGLGRHLFRYEGHWIFVHRQRDDNAKGGEHGFDSLLQRETYYVNAARWSKEAVRSFLDTARDKALARFGSGPDIYSGDDYGNWCHLQRAEPRPIGSVVLKAGLKEELLGRCRQFLDSRNWYRERGIPWRLGILLDGPPGNGKTSLAIALATELEMDLAVINFGRDQLGDAGLMSLMSRAGHKIILMEDVDALFEGRKKKSKDKVTFSGLLNALDGVTSSEGHIVLMTTNHPEKLDPALVRPGRVDVRIHLAKPDADQLRRLYARFYPEVSNDLAAAAFALEMLGCSMAEAQERLVAAKEEA
jgi:chaperone BCS1